MKTVKNIDFNLIIPKGTQIVLLNETKVLNENRFHAKGTVGKIVELPVDAAGARRTVAVYFSRSADRNNLMQTGEVEANLPKLNEKFRLHYLPELIERKTGGAEWGILPDADLGFYQKEYERLVLELEKETERSDLPETTNAKSDLNDLLIRIRLKNYD